MVRLDGVEIEFDPQSHVLLLRNEDRPAWSVRWVHQLGALGINIVNFALGAPTTGAAITVDALDRCPAGHLRAMPGVLAAAGGG